jgi:DHA1 family bicyclomycin/chloramphenicol resistance-like MFS transporter
MALPVLVWVRFERGQQCTAARLVNSTGINKRIAAILFCVIPLNQIPMDAYTPGLPQMRDTLGASITSLQSTVTAFAVGQALSYLIVGIMSDAWGRKPMILVGLWVLVATSLGCAMAHDIAIIILLRFAQGSACSVLMVTVVAAAADTFNGPHFRAVSGVLGAAWSSSPILAPAAGGFVVHHSSWRIVFVVIAVMALAAALLVTWGLPETLVKDRRIRFQFAASFQALATTVRSLNFLALVILSGLLVGPLVAFAVGAPFLYQDQMGFSPSAYGLVALLVGISALLGNFSTYLLAERMSFRRLAFTDWAVYAVGALLLLLSGPTSGLNAWTITIAAGLAIAGCTALAPQSQAVALKIFDRDLGLVSGLFGTLSTAIIATMVGIMSFFPQRTQTPLGWLYVACAAAAFAIVAWVTGRLRDERSLQVQ